MEGFLIVIAVFFAFGFFKIILFIFFGGIIEEDPAEWAKETFWCMLITLGIFVGIAYMMTDGDLEKCVPPSGPFGEGVNKVGNFLLIGTFFTITYAYVRHQFRLAKNKEGLFPNE